MRSTSASDYQHVPRPVAVMARDFASGATTGRHNHPRAQLLYAVAGLMIAATEDGTWAVPAGHALLIPPEVMHEVTMHGAVAMRTAYLTPAALALPPGARVLRVSNLLDAALVALADEPVLYDVEGRGGHLAALVLDEVARAPVTPFALPLPHDPRLRRLCRALIEAPSLPHDVDAWADRIGVSRRTLTRRFRDETGLSFGAWRRRLRLVEAMVRQARGDVTAQIAAAVGYGSPRALQSMMRRSLAAPARSRVAGAGLSPLVAGSAVERGRADLALDQAVQPCATPEKLMLNGELSPSAMSLDQAARDATDEPPAQAGSFIRVEGADPDEVGQGMAEKGSDIDHGHAP